jgi:hypothetical protein
MKNPKASAWLKRMEECVPSSPRAGTIYGLAALTPPLSITALGVAFIAEQLAGGPQWLLYDPWG